MDGGLEGLKDGGTKGRKDGKKEGRKEGRKDGRKDGGLRQCQAVTICVIYSRRHLPCTWTRGDRRPQVTSLVEHAGGKYNFRPQNFTVPMNLSKEREIIQMSQPHAVFDTRFPRELLVNRNTK